MRERRHLSGNSNRTPRPVSARCETSSDLVEEQRRGSLTARRAERDDDKRPPTAQPRRIHSARIERVTTVETPTPRPLTAAPVDPSALPRLTANHLGITSEDSQVQWAVHVAHPPPEPPTKVPTQLQDFSALLRDRYEGKRSLRLAFLNWDRDKDGQLSVQEIRDMIHSLGLTKKLGHANVDAIVDHVASLPSKSLKYDDFCCYIYTKPPPATDTARPTTAPVAVASDSVVASSDRALYPTVARVINLLRKKYESRQLRNVFRQWDADKDGCITLQELDTNLRRQGMKLPAAQLQELFDKHDVNKKGKLKYSEFMDMIYGPVASDHENPALQARLTEASKQENQPPDPLVILRNAALENPVQRIDENAICQAVQKKLKLFAPRIHDAYSAFDDDHNGNLSYQELRQGLKELGLHFTEREFLHLASMADTDGSGEISFREFSNLFHRGGAESPQHELAKESEHDPDLIAKQRARLDQGTFDFSHLTRRARIATRHGRTPYPNTADLISVNDPKARPGYNQFTTETSLYGSGQSHSRQRKGDAPSVVHLTLGQEEKQRKEMLYASRLDRIRRVKQEYDAKALPLHDVYDNMQQRRVDTLHRHQQRYNSSIEEQRPVQPQYSPHVVNRARHISTPPYLHL